MFFSEKFQVSSDLIKDYGAVDISLVCDIPLFIDPMLIFNSKKRFTKNYTIKLSVIFISFTKKQIKDYHKKKSMLGLILVKYLIIGLDMR